MLRTAISVAVLRSSLKPMAMYWVGVSARGQRRRVELGSALWTMNWKVPVSWVSRAVMSTSPLPCPAWPSPASKRAPAAWTG